MIGSVEQAVLQYIVRDHSRELFEQKKQLLEQITAQLNKKYPGMVSLEMHDQYYNMREIVEPKKYIVDLASEAMEAVGVKPQIKPIRGGTDGARLSFMGLPCPNLFTGGHNFHGRYEYVPVQSMEKIVLLLLEIVQKFTEM